MALTLEDLRRGLPWFRNRTVATESDGFPLPVASSENKRTPEELRELLLAGQPVEWEMILGAPRMRLTECTTVDGMVESRLHLATAELKQGQVHVTMGEVPKGAISRLYVLTTFDGQPMPIGYYAKVDKTDDFAYFAHDPGNPGTYNQTPAVARGALPIPANQSGIIHFSRAETNNFSATDINLVVKTAGIFLPEGEQQRLFGDPLGNYKRKPNTVRDFRIKLG